jgi:hypothetical protein
VNGVEGGKRTRVDQGEPGNYQRAALVYATAVGKWGKRERNSVRQTHIVIWLHKKFMLIYKANSNK